MDSYVREGKQEGEKTLHVPLETTAQTETTRAASGLRLTSRN